MTHTGYVGSINSAHIINETRYYAAADHLKYPLSNTDRYGDLRPNTSGGQIVAAIIMAFSYTVVVIGLSDRVMYTVRQPLKHRLTFFSTISTQYPVATTYRFAAVTPVRALTIYRCAEALIGACHRRWSSRPHPCPHPRALIRP